MMLELGEYLWSLIDDDPAINPDGKIWKFQVDGNTRTEVLFKGGERVGINRPDGTTLILGDRDEISELDLVSRRTTKWIGGEPPKGYRILSDPEIEQIEAEGLSPVAYPTRRVRLERVFCFTCEP